MNHISTNSFIKFYIKNNIPALISNEVNHWDAINKWNFEYLTKIAGNENISVGTVKPEGWGRDKVKGWMGQFKEMKMSTALSEIKTSSNQTRLYINRVSLKKKLSVLENDYEIPTCLKGKNVIDAALWVNGGNVTTRLHYDDNYGLMAQLKGIKRYVFFQPSDSKYLYAHPWYSSSPNWSRLPSTKDNELSKFPRYNKATPLVIELHPGQVLYVPPFWWHEVTNEGEENIAISYQFEHGNLINYNWKKIRLIFNSILENKKSKTWYDEVKE